MTYEQIVEKARSSYKNVLLKETDEHVAVEFDIYGEGEGAFYAEICSGKISVEPYEYYDRDAKIIITGDELEKILNGEKTYLESINDGIMAVEGNNEAAKRILELAKKVEKKEKTKKTVQKKSASKKAGEKKASSKTGAKRATKAEKEIVETTKKGNDAITKDIKK